MAASPAPRPVPGRKDTDGILSYYQSEDAGQTYTGADAEIEYERAHAHPMSTYTPANNNLHINTNTREYQQPSRRMSNASSTSSPSEYSPDTDRDEESNTKSFATSYSNSEPPPKASSQFLALRRQTTMSTLLEGGSGRRFGLGGAADIGLGLGLGFRAKVDQGKTSSSNAAPVRKASLKSRRGIDRPGSSSSIAPPPPDRDASQSQTYADMPTQPSTVAPLAPEKEKDEAYSPFSLPLSPRDLMSPQGPISPSPDVAHHRSSSDATTPNSATSSGSGSKSVKLRHTRKSSRNIGIVGTASGIAATHVHDYDYQHRSKSSESQDPLKSPIFQIPQSRSPSPKSAVSVSLSTRIQSQSPLHSPAGSVSGGTHMHASHKRGLSLKEEYISTMSVLGQEEEKDVRRGSSPVPHSGTKRPQTPPTKRSPPRRKPSPDTTISSSVSVSLANAYPSPPFSPDQPICVTAGPLPPPRPVFNSSPASILSQLPVPPRPPRVNSPALSTSSRSRGDVSSVKTLQVPGSSGLKSKTSNASFGSAGDARSASGSEKGDVVLLQCVFYSSFFSNSYCFGF